MSKLTLKQANTIIEKAFEKAQEMKTKPLAVVVLDESGNIVSAQRQDNASMFRIDVGLGKAWAAVAMGCSSRAAGQARQGQPQFHGDAGRDGERKVFCRKPGPC